MNTDPCQCDHALRNALLLGAVLTLATLGMTRGNWLLDVPDSAIYVDIAQGKEGQVQEPYRNRILQPYLVRAITRLTPLGVDRAFFITDVSALYLFLAAAGYILICVTGRPGVAVVALFSPFLLEVFKDGYLPDLPHAALLGAFFAMLMRRKLAAALVVLFVLQLTRESTVLLTLILAPLAFFRAEKKFALAAAAGTGLAMLIVWRISRLSPGNAHGVDTTVYLLLKVPFNLAKNVFGIRIWSNTLERLYGNPPPLVRCDLPHWLHLGSIRTIGYSGMALIFPARTLAIWLCELGVAPTLIFTEWRRRKKERQTGSPTRGLVRGQPLWAATALLYAGLSFLLAPGLGSVVWRLAGYGWPLLVVTPFLLAPWVGKNHRAIAGALMATHLLAVWIGGLLMTQWELSKAELLSLITLLICLHIAAGLALRRARPDITISAS